MSRLTFDPMAPEVIADPYPHYDRLRLADPVFRSPFGAWFLTRHDDVVSVLRDRRFGKNFEQGRTPQSLAEPVHRVMRHMMIYLNPPEHTRIRGLVVQAFSSRRLEEMRPRLVAIAEQLLDRVMAQGRMDIVRDFAFPLPLAVIGDILGIPEEDRDEFYARLPPGGRALDAAPMTRKDMEDANARTKYLEDFFLPLLAERRRKPTNDLLTHLVQAQTDGNRLSEEELISNVILLFGAGHETTTNSIGNSLVALFRHPEELAKLRREPTRLPDVIEELLRYDAAVQFGARAALEDVEIGGKMVEKGEIVIASLGAANRDPTVYEDPHRLNLDRANVRSMSFGGGIHVCLGAQLARMELEIALRTIFRYFPNLRLTELDRVRWKPSFIFRGPQSLPASW